MRKNRRPKNDTAADAVWSNPGDYTRAARRAVGYREPVSNSYQEGYRVGAAMVLGRLSAMQREAAEQEPADD